MIKKVTIALSGIIIVLWGWNTSIFMRTPENIDTRLIAHRGVHQTFDIKSVARDDCTAIMIEPPSHLYLENTIASIHAAFAAKADVVEIDIQPTLDGEFMVFHDWKLGCRTNGSGEVRKTAIAELQSLDIGYGYTFDGGESFPFRGKGLGEMPTLSQVFTAVPDGKFLINFKRNQTKEGQKFVAFMAGNPQWRSSMWGVYGGHRPTNVATSALGVKGYSRLSTKSCLKNYMLKGWSGYVPQACRETLVVVPQNYAKLMWGWPHKFTKRMDGVGSDVVLLGPHSPDNAGTTGIDDAASFAATPKNFDGYIWTNKIEIIGPLVAVGKANAPPNALPPQK